MKNNKEFIESFLNFEAENQLLQKKIKDVYFWAYIRFNIQKQILSQKFKTGVQQSNVNQRNKLKLFFKNLFLVIKKNPYFNIKKTDLLILNSPRRVKKGKYYECIHTDKWLKEINKDYYVFELPFEGKHFTPVQTKNLRYLDLVEFFNAISYKFSRTENFLNKNENKYLEKLHSDIEKAFKVDIDIRKFINQIIERIIKVSRTKKFIRRLLIKIKPKYIIEIVGYNMFSLALNEIAEEMNITTIEIQHGTIGKTHLGYNYKEVREYSWFPDEMLMFGEYWKNNNKIPISKDKLHIVGYPYLEESVKKYIRAKPKNSKIKILFISQPTTGVFVAESAKKLISKIDKSKFEIIYKLHPNEYDIWEERYSGLSTAGINVISSKNTHLYEIFAQSDFQVGVNSTAIFEGLYFGLKTFILKTIRHEYMEGLYNNGYAKLVSNEDEIIEYLYQDDFITFDSDYFWQKDSKNNIVTFINNLE